VTAVEKNEQPRRRRKCLSSLQHQVYNVTHNQEHATHGRGKRGRSPQGVSSATRRYPLAIGGVERYEAETPSSTDGSSLLYALER
jgi:hypothetical protein